MTSPSERRSDAWTALAAEPAVHAAERAIVTRSSILADTLAVSTAAESRRRLAGVLELKDRAERDPGLRAAYGRAADELRNWAAGVYLAALRDPPTSVAPPTTPFTEEAASSRRHAPRPPFPGRRRSTSHLTLV